MKYPGTETENSTRIASRRGSQVDACFSKLQSSEESAMFSKVKTLLTSKAWIFAAIGAAS